MKKETAASLRNRLHKIWKPTGILLILMIALIIPSATAAPPAGPVKIDFKCGTCEYLREQYARLRQGKKPVLNPAIVPDSFWSRPVSVTPQDAYDWPLTYNHPDQDRTDSDGDGLRECRYKLDFGRYITEGGYSTAQKEAFEAEFRKCAAIWNNALQHVGLELLEVTGNNYHALIQALNDAPGFTSNFAGQASLFGAWTDFNSSNDTPVFYLRSDITYYGAFLYMTENGAPRATYKRPPGNPFVYVFPSDEFYTEANFPEYYPSNISDLMLHEMGHFMGLEHPFEAYSSGTGNQPDSYLVDWLAYPTVGNPPPSARSTKLGGEDIAKTGWSRRFFNTFMTYDDNPYNAIYPDLPAPIKAYIAHYYGIFNPTSAQVLLDEALNEYNTYSPLANGSMITEVENNDSTPMRIQPGVPVLGALSKYNASDANLVENLLDTVDRYSFEIASGDLGRTMTIQTSIGTVFFDNFGYFTTSGGQDYNGNIQLVLTSPNSTVLQTSSVAEFPSMTFSPSTTGIYTLAVQKPTSQTEAVIKDYVLTVGFTDGQPPAAATLTPTPTSTPVTVAQSPTPISQKYDIDLAVERVFLVIDDGNNNFDDNVEITNPAPGQSIEFHALIRNIGYNTITDHGWELYVDGVLFRQYPSYVYNFNPQSTLDWPSASWSASTSGTHTVEWRFTTPGDQNTANNTLSLTFNVGTVQASNTPTTAPSNTPTNTRTHTPTNTATFTPTHTATTIPTAANTPTPVPTPVITNTPAPLSTATATPVTGGSVQVFDNANDSSGDLTGSTDFDSADNRNLTINFNGEQGGATDWHVYVRRGLGGLQYLGRTGSGSDRALEWYPNAPRLDAAFRNGPDYNSVYTFRMIRIDSQLDSSDIFDQTAPVGFNIDGGNAVKLALPDIPNLQAGEIVVYDDILGGNDLSAAAIGSDTDSSSWQALQVAWNFGADPSLVNEYHINVSVDGGAYQFLGQTYSGSINYFWWTPNRDFRTATGFTDGPQGGHTYQFRIILRPFSGSNQTLTGRVLQYNVSP